MNFSAIRLDVLMVVAVTTMALSMGHIVISALVGLAIPVFTLSRWDHFLDEQDMPKPESGAYLKAGGALVGLPVLLTLLAKWGDTFMDRGDIPATAASVLVAIAAFLAGSAAISRFARKTWNLPPKF